MSLIRFALQPSKMMVFSDTISRWVIPTAANYAQKTNLICDRANEDHCGSCGDIPTANASEVDMNSPILNKTEFGSNLMKKVFTSDELYYFPFTM
jgi:hypothetical protein